MIPPSSKPSPRLTRANCHSQPAKTGSSIAEPVLFPSHVTIYFRLTPPNSSAPYRVWRRVSDNYYFLDDASFDLQKERSQKECEASINALLGGGFIKKTLRENSYTLTDLGASFWVSSPKRYRRAAAQKQLDIFSRTLPRDQRQNRCNRRSRKSLQCPKSNCFRVIRPGEDPVGDIDIFIQLEVRNLEAVRKYQQRLSSAKAHAGTGICA